MNQEKSNKKIAIHIAISTVIFIAAFLVFPLGAEKIISPLILPVVLFWSILLIVANLIILFTMASIVFLTMFG